MAAFQGLEPGREHVVVREFTDFDGRVHPVGERWVFLRHTFLPYDDGLTLMVRSGGADWWIRMWWDERGQGAVVNRLWEYVRVV